jgi:hypothetical protein
MDHRIGTLMDMIDQQNETLAKVIAERDALRDEIKSLINWIQSDQDALTTLQRIYSDASKRDSERLRAASAAIGYEVAKPISASVVIGVNFAERLREERLKVMNMPPKSLSWDIPTNGKPPPIIDQDGDDAA